MHIFKNLGRKGQQNKIKKENQIFKIFLNITLNFYAQIQINILPVNFNPYFTNINKILNHLTRFSEPIIFSQSK